MRYTAPSTPSGMASSAANPVISSVPSTAGPMPPGKLSGMTLGGIGLPVRNFQLIAEAPFWITV